VNRNRNQLVLGIYPLCCGQKLTLKRNVLRKKIRPCPQAKDKRKHLKILSDVERHFAPIKYYNIIPFLADPNGRAV
jgi:hypothetical protein